MYDKEKSLRNNASPSAPPPIEEASAPIPDEMRTISSSECVICLEMVCQIIFVPCGHLCSCSHCSTLVSECPLCRSCIERKIAIT
ncbi:hypothetical protein NQ317_001782 [Molorchus minor]|uniref:RING-type domain-containing protein n=1 Tax=Molorchus minor TaxID=1323400 RepID=A0ABQ9IWA9_9CUCU|nr:hypothetical protein NQ317_001782 [Molorchus minor]